MHVSERALNVVLLCALSYLLLHWVAFRMQASIRQNAFLSRLFYGERKSSKEVFEQMYRKRRNVLVDDTPAPDGGRGVNSQLFYPPSYPPSVKQEEQLLLYDYCTNEDTLSAVQREMYRKSRAEVLRNGYDGSTGRWADGAFYENHYGGVEVDLLDNVNDTFSTLFYYQIYKNGNINMIDHLARFSKLYKNIRECARATHCSRLTTFDAEALKKTISYKEINGYFKTASMLAPRDRFPFTFVRDPLSRFISGYAEIESIIKENNINTDRLHLFAERGSAQRFEEFLTSLLVENGARDYLDILGHGSAHASYVAPQIGTLLFATLREHVPLRLYRLESFADEYARLAVDAKMERLSEVFSPLKIDSHFENSTIHSSALESAAAALSLSTAGNEDRARRLRKAICRVYLPDYTCLGFALPAECGSVEAELMAELRLVDAMKKRFGSSSDGSVSTLGLLRRARQLALGIVARVVCFRARSPECASTIRHPELYLRGEEL